MGSHKDAVKFGEKKEKISVKGPSFSYRLCTVLWGAIPDALANLSLGRVYQAQGDYHRAIDCLRQTVASLDGALRYERFGVPILPTVHVRAALAWCHAEFGTFAEDLSLVQKGSEAKRVPHSTPTLFPRAGGKESGPSHERGVPMWCGRI